MARPLPVVAVTTIVVAALLWWRTRHVRAMIAMTQRGRRLGDDGVVIGGEGFVLDRPNAPAVLLLHGAGDTPQTLRYLGAELHARGFHVAAPLLPGHGRRAADFTHISADQLTSAARASYDELKSTHEWVGIIGLSMGGALAVQLAADDAELPALGLAAPYLAMPAAIELAARLTWLWGPIVPMVRSGDGVSIFDPAERERGLAYGVFTAAALRALQLTVRRAVSALPRVAAPTLFVQSRRDNRISVDDAERAFARLGASEKRLEWVADGAHVITVDYGHEHVTALLIDWMQAHVRFHRAAG